MKKKLLFLSLALILLLMVSSLALMTGVTVTLDSSQPVSRQADALAEYIAGLTQAEQDEWFEALSNLAKAHSMVFALQTENTEDSTLYVTDSGQRYHRESNCSGLRNAKKISAVTKEVAIQMGRTPCKLCYPQGDPQ